jgi:8-oxo-dGTP pyrophosphatase MutT (NUDIX family)
VSGEARRVVRALIVAGDRLLLLRWREPGTGRVVWEPPGGAREPGESDVDALRREVWEEVGWRLSAIGRLIFVHRQEFRWADAVYRQDERFYLHTLEAPFHPRATRLSSTEQASLQAARWCPIRALEQLPGELVPAKLPAALRVALLDCPTGPVDLGFRSAL